jgi:ATP-dependent Clp protease ATP-binding subunit ClpA
MSAANPADLPVGNLPFTDEVHRLLSDADDEAGRRDHDYVGTEHLILALVGQLGDDAVLARLGIERHRVAEVLAGVMPPDGRGTPAPQREAAPL